MTPPDDSDALGFVIGSEEELVAFFDAFRTPEAQSNEAHRMQLAAKLAPAFETLGRRLIEEWSPILVTSGVVQFACEGLRQFGLGSYSAGIALRLLARAADEGPEAHAMLTASRAAQLAVEISKANPETSRIQFYMLYLVAALDDDAMRLEVATDGLYKSAIMAYRGHLFSEHQDTSMPTVRAAARPRLVPLGRRRRPAPAARRVPTWCSSPQGAPDPPRPRAQIAARAVANVARFPGTHEMAVTAEVLPWAVALIGGRSMSRVEDPETMARSREAMTPHSYRRMSAACLLATHSSLLPQPATRTPPALLSLLTATQAALLWVLANICRGGSYMYNKVSFAFDAIANCLREFEAHEGVAEAAAVAAHHLLEDRVVMRSQPLEAGLPPVLVRVAREHQRRPRVAHGMLLALRSVCGVADECADVAVRSGAISYAARCLKDFANDLTVVKAAMRCLTSAAVNTLEGRAELVSFLGVEAALPPVAQNTGDIELQVRSARRRPETRPLPSVRC